jgi:hypothetical protein
VKKMKELIKPNKLEEVYLELESYDESCGKHCTGELGRQVCNRVCSGGANNASPIDESDILF